MSKRFKSFVAFNQSLTPRLNCLTNCKKEKKNDFRLGDYEYSLVVDIPQ